MGIYSEECWIVYKYVDRYDPLQPEDNMWWEFIDNIDIEAICYSEDYAKHIVKQTNKDNPKYPLRFVKSSQGYANELIKYYNDSFKDCRTINDFEEVIRWKR